MKDIEIEEESADKLTKKVWVWRWDVRDYNNNANLILERYEELKRESRRYKYKEIEKYCRCSYGVLYGKKITTEAMAAKPVPLWVRRKAIASWRAEMEKAFRIHFPGATKSEMDINYKGAETP
jgi:hypothetical protein